MTELTLIAIYRDCTAAPTKLATRNADLIEALEDCAEILCCSDEFWMNDDIIPSHAKAVKWATQAMSDCESDGLIANLDNAVACSALSSRIDYRWEPFYVAAVEILEQSIATVLP